MASGPLSAVGRAEWDSDREAKQAITHPTPRLAYGRNAHADACLDHTQPAIVASATLGQADTWAEYSRWLDGIAGVASDDLADPAAWPMRA